MIVSYNNRINPSGTDISTSRLAPASDFLKKGFWASTMVLASRASGCLFGHPNPQKAPLRTPRFFCEEFLQMSISSIIIEYFHLHIISMILYKDIMPYFDNFIYVYG